MDILEDILKYNFPLNNSILGFTGSRYGMSEKQKEMTKIIVEYLKPSELHHGDCVGADKDCNDIVMNVLQNCERISHPGNISHLTAHCIVDKRLPIKKCLVRNRDIVKESDILIACPPTNEEIVRSGTWATIRNARKKGIPICIITKEGILIFENLP